MGLMSTILGVEMRDSPSVTGTFVGSGSDDDALEVVISLRQVRFLVFIIRALVVLTYD